MSDHEEQVKGSGRPDTSQDNRKEDGLAVFKEGERARGGSTAEEAGTDGVQPGPSDTGPETTSKD